MSTMSKGAPRGRGSSSPARDIDKVAAKIEQNALIVSLKKQVMDLRKKNEDQAKEMDDLRKSTKVCVYNELDA